MLEEGLYKAEFGTVIGRGIAVVSMRDGRIEGGDSGYLYAGTYVLSGAELSADLVVQHHTSGMHSLFGPLKEFDLALRGSVTRRQAHLTGTSKAAPDVTISVDLTKIAQ